MRSMKTFRIKLDMLHYASCLLLMTMVLLSAPSGLADQIQRSSMEQQRLDAKPWLVKNLEISGYTLPFSPITIIILWLSVSFLYSTLPKGSRAAVRVSSSAIASHILMHDKETLLRLKHDIGDNPEEFAKAAAEYSTCPSKEQGGMLGKFSPGTMAPAFEAAVFDPDAIVVGTTLGPVETHFGWHLIHVHERNVAE
jgi:parvulin-like peptidyl-prolyl isomerase